MQVQVIPRVNYLEIIAVTDSINAPKLIRLLDVLADALERHSSRNVLLEIRAQSRDIPVLEVFQIAARAAIKRIFQTRIAYVMTGRPLFSITRFYEDVAARRGVTLKFFATRKEGLDWLGVEGKTHST